MATSTDDTARQRAGNVLEPLDRFLHNPIAEKELRGRMRGGRAFLIVTGYLVLLSLGVGIILITFMNPGGPPPTISQRQELGKAIFGLVVGIQVLTICFLAPAMTAGAISSEREHQTYDLLRTTLLGARSLVAGKLIAAISFLSLLLFTAIPLQSLAFIFGGVAPEEILISILILLTTAFAFSALGLFFSSIVKRTLFSTVLSFTTVLILVFGIPILLVVGGGIFLSNTIYQPSLAFEGLLLGFSWVLVSINPLATIVISEVILIEEHSVVALLIPLTNGGNFYFLSPWISYTVFYLFVGLLLCWISIRLTNRLDR